MNNTQEKKNVRTLVGSVASDKMDKTIVVHIEIRTRHPMYGKIIRRKLKLFVHDEQNLGKEGDVVKIQEYRPVSRHKKWTLLHVIEKAQ